MFRPDFVLHALHHVASISLALIFRFYIYPRNMVIFITACSHNSSVISQHADKTVPYILGYIFFAVKPAKKRCHFLRIISGINCSYCILHHRIYFFCIAFSCFYVFHSVLPHIVIIKQAKYPSLVSENFDIWYCPLCLCLLWAFGRMSGCVNRA